MRRTPSPTALGLGAVLAFVQVMGSYGAAGKQPDRKAIDGLAIALLLVGPAAVSLRERRPHATAAVAITAAAVFVGLGYPYGPVYFSAVVGLIAAGLTGRRNAAWSLGAGALAAFALAEALEVDREGPFGWLHLGMLGAWLVAILVGTELVRTRRDQAAERARVTDEEERRRAGEERLRIAQDLHDVLAHDISLINVQAGVALHLVDEQPQQARVALANIKEASRDALQELRSALDLLRGRDDVPRAPAPRLADLPTLVDGVRASGLDIRLDVAPVPPLPAAAELAAYRVVQEALTNVTRHAHATGARVRVACAEDLTVEVVDDGIGGTPAGSGTGIGGMRERVGAVGGTLEAGPQPGGGFRIAARIPVETP